MRYIWATVLGFILFIFCHIWATDIRGYETLGGELVFWFAPLVPAVYGTWKRETGNGRGGTERREERGGGVLITARLLSLHTGAVFGRERFYLFFGKDILPGDTVLVSAMGSLRWAAVENCGVDAFWFNGDGRLLPCVFYVIRRGDCRGRKGAC